MAVHSRSFAALDPFEKSLELFSNLNTINFWENFCWIEFLEIKYKKNFSPTSKNIQIRIYNLIINYSNSFACTFSIQEEYGKKINIFECEIPNLQNLIVTKLKGGRVSPNWRLTDPPPSLQKRKFGIFADSCSTPSKMSRKVISDCGDRIFSVYCVTSLGCRYAVRIRVGRCVLHPGGPMCPT